jgi:hypothetical protein
MDLIDLIQENYNAIIYRLKELETLEYRKNNTKEHIDRCRKITTEMFRSIIQRKTEVIEERKKISNKCSILFHN